MRNFLGIWENKFCTWGFYDNVTLVSSLRKEFENNSIHNTFYITIYIIKYFCKYYNIKLFLFELQFSSAKVKYLCIENKLKNLQF